MVPVTGLRSLLATVIGLLVAHAKKGSFHLSMLSPYDLQRVLDQPVCSMF